MLTLSVSIDVPNFSEGGYYEIAVRSLTYPVMFWS
jgi:hypothetical protein